MKGITLYIGLISLAIALSSCEGNTDRTRQLRNNTSGLIQVVANGMYLSGYNAPISTGQTGHLFVSSQRGGSSYVENPSVGITEMIITNASGDTCIKDFTLQNNWEISLEETHKFPSNWQHEYTFSVNENDF